jgi:hypothetical protein
MGQAESCMCKSATNSTEQLYVRFKDDTQLPPNQLHRWVILTKFTPEGDWQAICTSTRWEQEKSKALKAGHKHWREIHRSTSEWDHTYSIAVETININDTGFSTFEHADFDEKDEDGTESESSASTKTCTITGCSEANG